MTYAFHIEKNSLSAANPKGDLAEKFFKNRPFAKIFLFLKFYFLVFANLIMQNDRMCKIEPMEQ